MPVNKEKDECPPVCTSDNNHQFDKGQIEHLHQGGWKPWRSRITITTRTCTKCGVVHTHEVSQGRGDQNYEQNTYESN